MKMTITPQSPRTFLPINLLITEAQETPQISVRSLAGDALPPFQVVLYGSDGAYQGTFWLRQAGVYQIAVATPSQNLTKKLHVAEQKFLPFQIEFGLFTALFVIVGIGIVLWQRHKLRSK